MGNDEKKVSTVIVATVPDLCRCGIGTKSAAERRLLFWGNNNAAK